jgi:hypothetical protein
MDETRDENAKNFQAAATKRYRNNIITSLETTDGRIISSHDEKAAILWSAYDDRMGSSSQPQEEPIPVFHDMDNLIEPFSQSEIDDVIKNIPSDRAPGPDGFNGCFIKSC